MLHQEQYPTDPSPLKSVYIMHYLTLQRLCEHSLTVKLTFCPLKDYHFDRIHKTLLCLVLTASYFRIFTDLWESVGGLDSENTQANPCSPDRLSDPSPSIFHTVEVNWGERALRGSWRFALHSPRLIRLQFIIPKRRKSGRWLWNPGWSRVANSVSDPF